METVEEIITYLEGELAEAYELYDQTKGKEAFFYMIKATIITHILEEIK